MKKYVVLESYMIPAEEGFFSKVRDMINQKKTDSNRLNQKIDELKALPIEKFVSLLVKRLASLSNDQIVARISKAPEVKKILDETVDSYIKEPGMINPTKSELKTIGGYPVIITTRKNKKTGEYEFSMITYGVQFIRDFSYAGKIVAHKDSYDMDVISGYTQAAKLLLD